MRVDLEDFGTGWVGLQIGIEDQEIDKLIGLLASLRTGDLDHFHIFSTSFEEQKNGVADIQFSKAIGGEASNADLNA
ncbi:MAG: hypothetical protein AAF764_04995 [Pseudomonadota bacterium]